jgi:uncharacterized membrane protein SpoIIM required for sporulation
MMMLMMVSTTTTTIDQDFLVMSTISWATNYLPVAVLVFWAPPGTPFAITATVIVRFSTIGITCSPALRRRSTSKKRRRRRRLNRFSSYSHHVVVVVVVVVFSSSFIIDATATMILQC